ncbi:hypothetical protein [Sandaracinus amylolyticus]|uniref:hypothetical protein n=1 Tax=Sandaracinus amylolyticus TaxID=927083 RepID=UPI001F27803B|nr:hypothetical protein [Sandaracinus amylolyticus]UJR85505.1 Hypothetical protein I5071_75850 [Sandaracinus amylolyticus]
MRRALSLFVLLLAGCNTGHLGSACSSHDDCEDVLVCGASEGAPYCTRRCRPDAQSSECPDGWSCTPRTGEPARGLCTQD